MPITQAEIDRLAAQLCLGRSDEIGGGEAQQRLAHREFGLQLVDVSLAEDIYQVAPGRLRLLSKDELVRYRLK